MSAVELELVERPSIGLCDRLTLSFPFLWGLGSSWVSREVAPGVSLPEDGEVWVLVDGAELSADLFPLRTEPSRKRGTGSAMPVSAVVCELNAPSVPEQIKFQ